MMEKYSVVKMELMMVMTEVYQLDGEKAISMVATLVEITVALKAGLTAKVVVV